jgi:hypothetical protein
MMHDHDLINSDEGVERENIYQGRQHMSSNVPHDDYSLFCMLDRRCILLTAHGSQYSTYLQTECSKTFLVDSVGPHKSLHKHQRGIQHIVYIRA